MARLFIAQIFLALAVIVSASSLSPRQSCGASYYYCSSTSGGSSGSGGASAADWIANGAIIMVLSTLEVTLNAPSICDRRMARCVVEVERNAAS
ncbi:hypothetical protein V501_08722 [Pseudogymnoascus sp. VKM F-4519 (FW-2642)]|nr:hypothetical protein V501_08722 [Pseudogymnoascus sp. VKM F-4519 (FW-2642)]